MGLPLLAWPLALGWAAFQLAVARWVILDPTLTRSVHLAFALALAFVSLPYGRRANRPDPRWSWVVATVAALLALYLVLDWEGLSARAGLPLSRDLWIGGLLVLVLLEATRRAIGPALPLIAGFFSVYVFLGPYLPGPLSFPGASLPRYLNQVALSTEGIYGIPLDVSASTVFLFVLLGGILERCGAGEFFTQTALALLGRFKGGPAKAAVVSSGLTGLVSGSSISNIVTTGTFTIPLMKRSGFPAKKAAAIEVAASTDGQLMPPVMGAAAFIIAEYVNLPYLEVVKAALIPALLSYGALFYVTHLEASKLGMKGLAKADRPVLWPLLKAGWHHLIPLAVLAWELVVLRHSPKLAAFNAILTLAGLLLGMMLFQAKVQRRSLWSGLADTGRILGEGMVRGAVNMVPVALATAAAGILIGTVGLGLGGMLTSWVEQLSGGQLLPLLAITAVASLLLGMGLPTTATYIVMASLTAPIIVTLGQQEGWAIPLMAAHLFCFYFGILADDTPPVGLASYAAAAIAKSDPIATGLQAFYYDLRTVIIPFMFVLNPELILHGITSWTQGLWILGRSLLGALAFTSLLQNYLITDNRWPERPMLLLGALTLMHPTIFKFWGLGNATLLGLLALVIAWGMQYRRVGTCSVDCGEPA
ncbi:MAG: TRAP transporter permease [bacterium]|nr:TRAP transporter permease [bacterium]